MHPHRIRVLTVAPGSVTPFAGSLVEVIETVKSYRVPGGQAVRVRVKVGHPTHWGLWTGDTTTVDPRLLREVLPEERSTVEGVVAGNGKARGRWARRGALAASNLHAEPDAPSDGPEPLEAP